MPSAVPPTGSDQSQQVDQSQEKIHSFPAKSCIELTQQHQEFYQPLLSGGTITPEEVEILHRIGIAGNSNRPGLLGSKSRSMGAVVAAYSKQHGADISQIEGYAEEIFAALSLRQYGVDISQVEALSEKYPSAVKALFLKFGDVTLGVEVCHAEQLERIYTSLPDYDCTQAFSYLPKKAFLKDPEAIAQMYERYGSAAIGVFRTLRNSLLEEEPIFREVLEAVSVAARRDDFVFRSLDVDVMRRFPNEMAAIAHHVKGGIAIALDYLPEELEKDPDEVVAIAERWGELAGYVFAYCSEDLVAREQKSRSALEQFVSAVENFGCKDWAGLCIKNLSPEELLPHVHTFMDLIELTCKEDDVLAGQRLADLCSFLNDNPLILSNAVPMLQSVAAQRNSELVREILPVSMTLVDKDPELLYQIALAADGEVHQIFEHLDDELALSRRSEVLGIVQRYGKHAGGLMKAFGAELIEGVEGRRGDIFEAINRYHEGASEFFATIPPNRWGSVEEYDFGSATPRVLVQAESERSALSYELIADIRSLIDENRRQFNICNLQRYLCHDDGEELLRENLRNLDPDYKPDRQIILYGIAQDDSNGALANGVVSVLKNLSESSRLLFFELSCYDELVIQALRGSSLFGVDSEGEFNRRNHAVFVSAHANESLALLSKRSVSDVELENPDVARMRNGVLGMENHELYEEVGATIESGGYFGVFGCSPGRRVNGSDSLIDSIARSIPHVQVLGSTKMITSSQFSASHSIRLKENGFVDDIKIGGSAAKVLHRLPASSDSIE